MKVVVGIDSSEECLNAVSLIGSLALPQSELQFVHVIERLSPEQWRSKPMSASDLIAQFLRMQEEEGEASLNKAKDIAKKFPVRYEAFLKYGNTAANQILEMAQTNGAKLIAVGSRDETLFGKMLIGSVGRKLIVSSPQSLCICRSNFADKIEPIDAVFATDHSEYASQCVDTLLALAPKGLRSLTIMTAYPKQLVKAMKGIAPKTPADIAKWLEDHLEQQNQLVKERLKGLCTDIKSQVFDGEPNEAIDVTMAKTKAKLLIMGAQGHGFLERLTTGSLTFRQAAAGKHSVLILRVDPR